MKALQNEYDFQYAFENPSYFGVKTFVCDIKTKCIFIQPKTVTRT